MTYSSGILSTLKQLICTSKASFISQSAFPTPAKTMLEAGNPAARAAFISPPLTQSAPSPFLEFVD